jgi:hypothetical protein
MNKILKIGLICLGIIIVGIIVKEAVFPSQITKKIFFPSQLSVDKKPAIYLYPTENMYVSVKLDVDGKIIKDIPKYNNGWTVFVTKDGLIDNKYDYLFYEVELNQVTIPEDGWVVAYNDLDNWFEINLEKLGLNEKEKFQFKDYWLKELPKSNYYIIKLLSNQFLDDNMDLIINPSPDTEIRLNFYFKSINKSIQLKTPEIITPNRNGFTVIEWGGILGN